MAEIVKDTNIELTEFEFITAIAFLYFSQENCDIAIIETGLGGRLDATNTLENVIANVITKIGLDHTAVLGDTIEKIAYEKCGIIKNCPVITSYNQCKEAFSVLQEHNPIVPEKKQLEILKSDMDGNTYIYKGKKYNTSLVGSYQIENSLIVIETIENCGIDIPYNIISEALNETYFPARMEVISKEPLIILDGAHNPDGAKALAENIKKFNGNITALVGMMRDKDCEEVLKTVLPYCKNAVAVDVENMLRSLNSGELKKLAEKYCTCVVAQNYDKAIELIAKENAVIIFGSLYLASAIRNKLKKFFNS